MRELADILELLTLPDPKPIVANLDTLGDDLRHATKNGLFPLYLQDSGDLRDAVEVVLRHHGIEYQPVIDHMDNSHGLIMVTESLYPALDAAVGRVRTLCETHGVTPCCIREFTCGFVPGYERLSSMGDLIGQVYELVDIEGRHSIQALLKAIGTPHGLGMNLKKENYGIIGDDYYNQGFSTLRLESEPYECLPPDRDEHMVTISLKDFDVRDPIWQSVARQSGLCYLPDPKTRLRFRERIRDASCSVIGMLPSGSSKDSIEVALSRNVGESPIYLEPSSTIAKICPISEFVEHVRILAADGLPLALRLNGLANTPDLINALVQPDVNPFSAIDISGFESPLDLFPIARSVSESLESWSLTIWRYQHPSNVRGFVLRARRNR